MQGYARIVIPRHRPMSWNLVWNGKVQKFERAKYAKQVRHDVHVRWLEQRNSDENRAVVELVPPLVVVVTAYFDKNPLDTDNVLAKSLIDGLKQAKIIEDDNMKFVGKVLTDAKLDPENPRTEIELFSNLTDALQTLIKREEVAA